LDQSDQEQELDLPGEDQKGWEGALDQVRPNIELLRHASDWALDPDDAYLAFYVACSDATPDKESVLRRVVNSLTNLQVEYTATGAGELVDWTTHKRVSFKMFSIETTRTYREPSKPSDEHLTIEELLLKSVSRLAEEHKQRVLIVIDEVDRMKEKVGLAAFIKVASSSDLKFVLVGIAESVSDLLTDHRSLERVIMPVKVPRMPVYELGQTSTAR
jgi:Cdc6-like AAA superfamily ATPase